MNSILYFTCILFIILCTNNCKVDKSRLTAFDIEIYSDTPVWELAKAVEREDSLKIKNLIFNSKIDVDYKETIFGMSLLNWAVFNYKINSTSLLLRLGSNPDMKIKSGQSPILDASENLISSEYLKVLIKYGADINIISKVNNSFFQTPLMAAAATNLSNTKILVEAGANINFKDSGNYQSALSEAIISQRIEIVEYLLQKGANFKDPLAKWDGKYIYICNFLRDLKFPLGSENYKIKMRVVDFLKKNGIDYRNQSINKSTIDEIKRDYRDDWEYYIDNY